jgi:YVTN family beta-propeller protein
MSSRLLGGTILNERYKIRECICSHEFSNIYTAEDITENKEIIVKELLNEAIDDKYRHDALEKFHSEVSIYKKIRHKHIASIIDSFSVENEVIYKENKQFIIMEYVKGRTIKEIKNGKEDISAELLASWVEQICNVLIFFNEGEDKLLFYYLSPEHIIITEENEVKLINFGLGRFFRKGPFVSNQYMGIPGYASPEQYGIKGIDSRSDMFGLGAIIYYILTEDDPSSHPLSFSPVKTFSPAVSNECARFVSRCLQMKPEDRFENFLAFKEKFASLKIFESQISTDMIKKKKKEEIVFETKVLKPVGKEARGLWDKLSWTAEKYIPAHRRGYALVGVFIVAITVFLINHYINSGVKLPDSVIYVSHINSDSLIIMDKSKKSILKKLGTGECISNMLFYNNKIYIGGPVLNLIKIDAEKGEVEDNIKVSSSILEMVITKDGRTIYGTATVDGKVIKIIPATKSVSSSIMVGEAPTGLSLSDNEHFLYVANFKSNNISIIDTTDNTIAGTIENAGKNPKKLLLIPGKNLLYCLNWGSDDITVINTANNTINKRINVGKSPNDMVLLPDNKTVYVSNGKSQSISIIDTDKEKTISEINLPGYPNYLRLSADKKQVFSSVSSINKEDNKIIILDPVNNEIKDEIPLEKYAFSLMEIKLN